MGLLRTLLELHQHKQEMDESKRRYNEELKLRQAEFDVNRAKMMKDFSEGLLNISPTITTPEGERVQHPLLKETGLQPDWERMTIGQEGAGVQVPKNLLEGYYDSLLKARQGETEHGYRMEEKKTPSGTTRQPTQYEIWKGQQPKGADTSLVAFKKSMTGATERTGERDWLKEYLNWQIDETDTPEKFIQTLPKPFQEEASKSLLGIGNLNTAGGMDDKTVLDEMAKRLQSQIDSLQIKK